LTRFDGSEQTLKLEGAATEPFGMTRRQELLSWIMNPNVALVLGLLGMIGLYIEATHPGLIVPGVVGGISLILALFAFNLLPINLSGVALILLAVGLFVMEATVTSHGVLAIGGVVSLVAGGLLLVEGPIPELRIQLSTMLAIAIPMAAITVFLVRLVFVSHRRKASTGDSGVIGVAGTALTEVHKTGKVMIQGEVWNAWARSAVPQGAAVRVVGAEGLKVEVQIESEGNS
jgi:membrane-bound serine protease (ClpP class)